MHNKVLFQNGEKESIRNVVINSNGLRAVTKDLEGRVIMKFHSHKTVKTLPGHGAKKKLNETSLKVKVDCGEKRHLKSFRLTSSNLESWFQAVPDTAHDGQERNH